MLLFVFLFYAQDSGFFIINNSKFSEQFYVVNNGQNYGVPGEDINVFQSWEKHYTGNGIQIEVYGTPCNSSVAALQGRIERNCSGMSKGNTFCDFKKYDDSGTQIASLIAGNKGTSCNIGIAYESKLLCNPLVNSINETPSNEMIQRALESDQNIHIKSFPFTSECKNHKIPVNVLPAVDNQNISFNMFYRGRGGLGTIAVFTPSMCNGIGSDPNYKFITQTRFPINVAASTFRGRKAFYSPTSSNFIVNVPSTNSELFVDDQNIVTNPTYAVHGDGTCEIGPSKFPAANAIATGGIALVLQRYTMLSSRALQLILELSATINDANHSSWTTNAVGIKYSNIYGFGRLNINKAIELAGVETFKFIPKEYFEHNTQNLKNPPIPACMQDPLVVNHKIGGKIQFIEAVTISISTYHQNVGDLRIELKSPSGTKVVVNDVAPTEKSTSNFNVFTFTVRQFLGEKAGGNWELSISAIGCIPTGRIKKTSLTVYGMKNFTFNQQKTGKNFEFNRTAFNNENMNNSYGGKGGNIPGHNVNPPIMSISRDIRPSNNASYPESKEISYNLNSSTKDLSCGAQYKLLFSCPREYENSPAIVYVTSNTSSEPIIPLYFEHASQVNNFKLQQPFLGRERVEFNYVIEVIASPTNILLKRSGPWIYNPCNISVKQYQVIQRNENITTPFLLKNAKSDVYMTLADYDREVVLSKGIQKNTGKVSFMISDTLVERGILTIGGMNSDPCDLFVNTFYVGENKDEKPFSINISNSCPKISNLAYSEPPSEKTDVNSPTISVTDASNSKSSDSNSQDNSNSGETNSSDTVITIVSIIAVLAVVAVVGSILAVYKLRQMKIREQQSYFSAADDDPKVVSESAL